MIQEQIDAMLQQKNDLIKSQSEEIWYLRQTLDAIRAKAAHAVAGYMSANGWVRQEADGSVVPND